MKKISNMIEIFKVQKTLRFGAKPEGKTGEYIIQNGILERDRKRSKDYKVLKFYLDECHRDFIDKALNNIELEELREYAELFFQSPKDNKNKMKQLEDKMRKQICEHFKESGKKKLLSKSVLTEVLPEYFAEKGVEIPDEVNNFKGFFTSRRGFCLNRENMYASEPKHTAVAYRCINENLPKFLRNIECFDKIKKVIAKEELDEISNKINFEPYRIEDCFSVDFYNLCLSQKGIDMYNTFMGGYSKEDGTKIQGLNEIVNLYNQKIKNNREKHKLPQITPLYKQILSDSVSKSFSLDKYDCAADVIKAVRESYMGDTLERIGKIFNEFDEYDTSGIYIKNGTAITTISNAISDNWMLFRDNWNSEYDSKKKRSKIKDIEKYEENRNKTYKKIDSFSIDEIAGLLNKNVEDLIKYYQCNINELLKSISESYTIFKSVFDSKEVDEDDYEFSEKEIEEIKTYLDDVKKLESLLKQFMLNGKENNIDYVFYGDFIPAFDRICEIDSIYNKVRNYITSTRKPYKSDKYRLYFDNPQMLEGWDINKENARKTSMLLKDGQYYFAIINDKKSPFDNIPDEYVEDRDYYKKMIYKQIPNAAKYISGKNIKNPPLEISEILKKRKKDSKSLTEDEKNRFIDYVKTDFLVNYEPIIDKNGNRYFDFKFKNAEEYPTLEGFFEDVNRQAYSIRFKKISTRYINELVENGQIYLFRIYSKDFSEYSKGNKNLHTMYFEALFDEDNLENQIMKLNGGAEFFIRPASISKDKLIVHNKGQKLDNKNPLNSKKQSVFNYDLIKDKRFTEDQYMLHVSIDINKNAMEEENVQTINERVRKELKECDDNYIIGIDRGERNLIYICVINGNVEIVEQMSLNNIINEYNSVQHTTDYHKLLSKCEAERDKQRKSWKSIENIKELKDGYLSQVVHKICQLVEKYDAIIAMEDLNRGFVRNRLKFEKQVYQKFEKKLIDKLNYMVDKNKQEMENGGILKGYQLANSFNKDSSFQNGFVFYVPAWLTSKIDPTTGFVDFLKPKYVSVNESCEWISRFDSIKYDKSIDMFGFDIDYSNFTRADIDYRKKWTFYSNGDRIEEFRNSNTNNKNDYKVIKLSEEIKKLLESYNISYIGGDDIIPAIKCISDKGFWVNFIRYIKLTLQMRNNITGKTDVDYIISPVMNNMGNFYDSRQYDNEDSSLLPQNADANGAYNIARKALWAIDRIKEAEDDELKNVKIAISNKEWIEYAQTHFIKKEC